MLLLSGAGLLGAHSAYQAALLLDFQGNVVEAELQLPLSRLQSAAGTQQLTPETVSRYLSGRMRATLPDGRAFRAAEAAVPAIASIDGAPYYVAHLRLTPPDQANADLFDLECDALLDHIPSQVILVSTRSDWRTSTFANDPALLGVLRAGSRHVPVDRRDGSWWRGFGSVFHLGMRHIAEGTDHLLFLLVLLLPAPLLAAGGRWAGHNSLRQCLWQIGKVVTAFTLGHSVTLAAGALNLVHVPSRPIEVLIAASILVSAVHALRPIFPGREAVIAGGFGLVHGLAFASTLAELGLGRWERVASIFGFNLGIEAMQLVVVAAALPSLLLFSRTRLYDYGIRLPGAVFGGVAAAGWMGERLAGLPNPIDGLVTALAQRAVWIAVVLFVLGVIAWSLSRLRGLGVFDLSAAARRRVRA